MGCERNPPSLASTATVVAAVMFAGVGAEAGELTPDAEVETESAAPRHHHQEPPSPLPLSLPLHRDLRRGRPRAAHFRRRLALSAQDAFAAWTTDKVALALPLDLLLDEGGVGYLAGPHDYREPYLGAFAAGRRSSRYWDSIRQVNDVIRGARDGQSSREREEPDTHVQTPHLSAGGNRMYDDHKRLEEELFHERALRKGGIVHLDSLEFKKEEGDEVLYKSQEGIEEEKEEEEEEAPVLVADEGRHLRVLPRNSSPRRTFRHKKESNKKDKSKQNNKKKNQNKKKKLPIIENLVPVKNAAIQDRQTFSAHVRPSEVTKADISLVSFQLEDEEGNKSGWLPIPQVGKGMGRGDLHEITIDGFGEYPGSKWVYMIQIEDQKGRKKTASVKVVVAAFGLAKAPPAPPPPAPGPPGPSPPASPLPRAHVADSDWPHGGAIRSAVGRILFEFDDNADQPFVCSGTVVMDGPDGRTPDGGNGRTLVQTAAHCAYNDVLKKFARRAVFIPDQASTRGSKSNFDCGDDIYGCWYLSFAVVAKGWAWQNFPNNVPYDYAYYTVFDGASTHSGGYSRQGLTGILDRDVTPMALDFNSDPRGEFVYSVGYSADKDPSLRHCSMANTDIYGLSSYANLWLNDCAMTGGASGGPWTIDMDDKGVGTLISVNSWGFTDRTGMAGPVLRTKDGSWAECLYDKAKSARDPGEVGGIIVDEC